MTACSPVKIPDNSTYILTLPPQPVGVAGIPVSYKTVFVSQPDAAPGANTQKMAYVKEAYQLEYFTKNQWVDKPANMLLPLIVQTLQNTHRFKAVVGAPFSGVSDLRLDTTVLALRQNFMTKPGEEDLVVYAQLIRTSTQEVIASQRFAVQTPVANATPYGGVQAANQAVAVFLQQLTQFVLKNSK
jgi:cholesterol transport system auxiliary component